MTAPLPPEEHGPPNMPPDQPRPRDLLGPPEWLRLIVRRREDGAFLLVRREPSAPFTLLSTWPPGQAEGLEEAVGAILRTHLHVNPVAAPTLSDTGWPARMHHPYTGGQSMGLMRAVAIEVSGEPEVDALYQSVAALSTGEAERALATELERAIFRDGVALLD